VTIRTFENWSGLHRRTPREWISPHDEDELRRILQSAATEGRRVKVVGGAHSWSDIAVPDDVAVDLAGMRGVVGIDRDAPSVTARGGTRLEEITEALDAHGLALPILGSIAKQTIAGAIATGTHGSSLVHGNLSSLVLSMRLMTACGDVLHLKGDDPRLAAARVHLGALGVVTEVTLRATKAFRLAEKREPIAFADVVRDLESLARSAEYVKIWWLPSAGSAVIFRYERSDAAEAGAALARWADEAIVNRHVFERALRFVGRFPGLTGGLNAAVTSTYLGPAERVARSDRAFNLAMPPIHREAEWAFGMKVAPLALEALATLVRRDRLRINFPCEIRFVRRDDAWMSPAEGRDTCQIGVYQAASPDLEPWFGGAATIARNLDGRPHWGKEHAFGVHELEWAYPRFGAFKELARELDPRGTFVNPHLARILGDHP
jgi:FAD/FMN-containing dehydrogenase